MPTPLDQIPQQRQPQQQQGADGGRQEPQGQPQRDPRDTSRVSPDTLMDFRHDQLPPETGDNDGTPPQDGDDKGQMVPLSALKEERAKRQEYETRFNDLAARLDRVETVAQPQREEPQIELPDPLDDPEGFRKAVVEQATAAARSETLAMSVEMVREANADYDEAEKAFVELAKADPALQERFRKSKNPGKFVYDHGKRALTAKKMQSDPEAYEADLTERIMARLRKQGVIPGDAGDSQFRQQGGSQQRQEEQTQTRRFPSSIATQRAVAPRTNPGFSGPTPLTSFPGPAARRAQ